MARLPPERPSPSPGLPAQLVGNWVEVGPGRCRSSRRDGLAPPERTGVRSWLFSVLAAWRYEASVARGRPHRRRRRRQRALSSSMPIAQVSPPATRLHTPAPTHASSHIRHICAPVTRSEVCSEARSEEPASLASPGSIRDRAAAARFNALE